MGFLVKWDISALISKMEQFKAYDDKVEEKKHQEDSKASFKRTSTFLTESNI